MAEVGYSVDPGQKQKTDECEICIIERRDSYAKFVCLQCRLKVCPECRDQHLKSMATQSHNLQEISSSFRPQTVSGMSSLNLGSEAIEPPLCKEHCQEIKFFCTKHLSELCLTCRRMEHKQCQTVITIEDAAKEVYTECHEDKIIQSAKRLSEHFQECRSISKESKTKLPLKKQMAIDSVKQTKRSVEAFLDRLETDALAEIDTIFDEELKALDEQISICNASISALNASLSSLERMLSVRYNEGKFVEINKVTKQVKQYCNMLLDVHQELYDFNVKFKENGKISNLKAMLENFGKSEVIKSSVACVTIASVSIYTGEIKVKTDNSYDSELCITSFDVLPDGKRVLLDYSLKIQVYDQDNFFVTESSLPFWPNETFSSLGLVSTNEAIVSTYSDKLFEVTINEDLVIAETTAKHLIGPMVRYGEQIMALIGINDISHIVVMDRAGNIKKIILKDEDQTLFAAPLHIAVNTDRTILFIVDGEMGCYGITTDGQILFRYQDPEADGYFGLAVGNDCVFLDVRHSDEQFHVQQINFSGVREQCHDFGSEVFPLKVVNNELVLFTEDEKENPLINFYFLLNRKKSLIEITGTCN